jgi:4-carboxymuconolactone decarboxylase
VTADRPPPVPVLDDRTHTLVRLAVLVALGAHRSAYRQTVGAAIAAGASIADVIGTVAAVAPAVGVARIVAAADDVAAALGYDIDLDLEGER